MIKKYLVGGAVRDQIMGIRTNDFDYVVVGSSPDEMIKLGFKPIGRDFPVFLHPDSHEEYALARTEKKISKGSPNDTTALVGIPKRAGTPPTQVIVNDQVVWANGESASQPDAITFEENNEHYLTFTVQPGSWAFKAAFNK